MHICADRSGFSFCSGGPRLLEGALSRRANFPIAYSTLSKRSSAQQRGSLRQPLAYRNSERAAVQHLVRHDLSRHDLNAERAFRDVPVQSIMGATENCGANMLVLFRFIDRQGIADFAADGNSSRKLRYFSFISNV